MAALVALALAAASVLASAAPVPPPAAKGPSVLYNSRVECPAGGTLQNAPCGNDQANGNPANTFSNCGQTQGNSELVGGNANTIDSSDAGLLAGSFGTITCPALRGYVGAGVSNTVAAEDGVVAAGESNEAHAASAFVGAGDLNLVYGLQAGIVAGHQNHVNAARSVVLAGSYHYIHMDNSAVGAGTNNTIWGNYANQVAEDRCGPLEPDAQEVGGEVPAGLAGTPVGPAPGVGTAAGQVDLPCASFIGGGTKNTIRAGDAAIGGGTKNLIDSNGKGGFIGGGASNTVNGASGGVLAGLSNVDEGLRSLIGGGATNSMPCARGAKGVILFCPYENLIGAGTSNTDQGVDTAIMSGTLNTNVGFASTIVAGRGNFMAANEGLIGGGQQNTVGANGAFVGAGQVNTVAATNGFIGAGLQNAILDNNGVVGAGRGNIVTGEESFIGAGRANRNFGAADGILAGDANSAGATGAFVGAGASNAAGGTASVIGAGRLNLARAAWTGIPGGCQAIADVDGQLTQAACGFPQSTLSCRDNATSACGPKIAGTAQRSLFEVRGAIQTTGATAQTDLLSANGVQLTLRGATSWSFHIQCSAASDAHDKAQAWTIDGAVARAGLGIRMVGTPVTARASMDSATAGWDCVPTVDAAHDALVVRVKADTNVRFSASIDTVEVQYGDDA